MKAIVLRHPGGPSALSYEDVPTPKVRDGWTLLKVKGFGINRSEIFTRNGWSPSVKLPRILGIECVGEVVETTDSDHLLKGQIVVSVMGGMGRVFNGSYAEYVLLSNKQIYSVNTKLTISDLTAVPETYGTAYGSLIKLQLDDADSLLIRGATSGVGVAAAKLAFFIVIEIKINGMLALSSKALFVGSRSTATSKIPITERSITVCSAFSCISGLFSPAKIIMTLKLWASACC